MNREKPVLKVLVCDDTADYGIRIASKLNENNIYAYTRRKDAEVILNSIARDCPDVVIIDLSLNHSDAAQSRRPSGLRKTTY